MLTGQLRIIITLLNLIFLGILPLVCRMIAVHAGRAQPFLATISGHYLVSPERWLFAGGVAIFVVIHIGVTGLLSPTIPNATALTRQYCQILEMLLLGAFLLIACVPAHVILGLHATLGAVLIGVSLLWMSTILQHISLALPVWYWIGNAMLIGAAISTLGMMSTFPSGVISELVVSRGNLERTLYLLAWDHRWLLFACFEWAYYYCLIIFMMVMASYSQQLA